MKHRETKNKAMTLVIMILLFVLSVELTSFVKKTTNHVLADSQEQVIDISDEPIVLPDMSHIKSICELGTQEYYYHNVSKYFEEKCEGFWVWKKDKSFWIEYTGIVTIGIDGSQIQMSIDNNKISIYVPEAKIISSSLELETINEKSVYIDNKSAKVTPVDISNLYGDSEQEMLIKISSDKDILLESQNKAKDLIEGYIHQLGSLSNTSYSIEWVNKDFFTTQKNVIKKKEEVVKKPKEYKKVLGYNNINLTNDLSIVRVEYEWGVKLKQRETTDMIILHHSDSDNLSIESVHKYHQDNGWAGIGYHYVVKKDGTIYTGRPDNTVGTHSKGANSNSIGICFEGDYEKTEVMPDTQKEAGRKLIKYLENKYGISTVKKHSDVSATSCPGKYFPFNDFLN